MKNYRTLEEIDVTFDGNYTAISGANNSGKSNFINAIHILLGHEDEYGTNRIDLSHVNDFTKWKLNSKDDVEAESVHLSADLQLDNSRDSSLILFLQKMLSVDGPVELVTIDLEVKPNESTQRPTVTSGDKKVTGAEASEILKRIRTGRAIVYHNSTTESMRTRYLGGLGQISELSDLAHGVLEQSRAELTKKLKKAAAPQQEKLQLLLNNLPGGLSVEVELPRSLGYLPYNLALSQGGASVALGSWGSGTQNQTLILLAMIKASQADTSSDSTDRITPILLVEEPESFLHPLAQSQFGTTLIKLASELDVQLIVATHSVCLLNTEAPSANLLFERETFRNRPKKTRICDHSEDNWMAPFANLLGYSDESFSPWQKVLSSRGKRIILVEGDTDRRYLESLKVLSSDKDRLFDDVEVLPYDGVDNLSSGSILRLVINLASRCIVTYDLDAQEKLKRTFNHLGLKDEEDTFAVGYGDGRACIEDLVPERFHDEVYSANPNLVTKLMGDSKEAKSAKSEMKKRICDHFLANASDADYKDLVSLGRRLKKHL